MESSMTRMIRSPSTLAAALVLIAPLLAAPSLAQEIKAGPIVITAPFARATPAGAQVAGGYLTIVNGGQTPDRLVSLTADISARPELHEMKMENGTMVMRQLEKGIPLPPGAKVELKPGGLHLMFMSITRQLKPGESVRATLEFEKAGKVDVVFPVVPIGGQAPAAGHGSHKAH
jgi:hypothetical protein